MIASYSAAGLAGSGGFATLSLNTTSESFALLTVTDAAGGTVAVSNPVWLLRTAPPNGIPAARQA